MTGKFALGHHLAPPQNPAEWGEALRARFDRKNRELGLRTRRAVEVFQVTAWGVVPTMGQLLGDFPALLTRASALESLGERLQRWRRA